MSALTDIATWLWIFFTGAAAARIAFAPRKKININVDLYPRWLTTVKAEAWDEGFADGVNHDLGDWENAPSIINNPYRKEQDR